AVVNQYEYFVPNVAIKSIGSGGGSLVRVDDVSRSVRVGPQSAGAYPGPACLGRGGAEPTVADADLLLGYLNPDYFLGGRIRLDRDAAEAALARVGGSVGMSALELAAAAAKIVDYKMADLIRQVVVQAGHDPRDFVVFAF